jgi:hypothetical protein
MSIYVGVNGILLGHGEKSKVNGSESEPANAKPFEFRGSKGWVCMPIVATPFALHSDHVAHTNHPTERTSIMNTKNIKKALVAGAIGVISFAMPIAAQVSAKAPESCRSFSSGRTTCSYSNGSGGTSWSSYNPYSGYSSYGYRQSSGGSSWGSYNYTLPSGRSGSRSYNNWSNCWGC